MRLRPAGKPAASTRGCGEHASRRPTCKPAANTCMQAGMQASSRTHASGQRMHASQHARAAAVPTRTPVQLRRPASTPARLRRLARLRLHASTPARLLLSTPVTQELEEHDDAAGHVKHRELRAGGVGRALVCGRASSGRGHASSGARLYAEKPRAQAASANSCRRRASSGRGCSIDLEEETLMKTFDGYRQPQIQHAAPRGAPTAATRTREGDPNIKLDLRWGSSGLRSLSMGGTRWPLASSTPPQADE